MTNGKAESSQLVKWALNAVTAVGLGVGAWFFNSINDNVTELTTAVNGLKTEVALLQKSDEKITELYVLTVQLQKDMTAAEKRLILVEATRFTGKDGDELKISLRNLDNKLRDLDQKLHNLNGHKHE